jgi:enamine deaminase RidA (YjgF/YER057c/UK114 family)
MKYLLIMLMVGLVACTGSTSDTKKASLQQDELYDYDVEQRIEQLGIKLTEPGAPVANYVNAVTTGNLVFLAGKGPKDADGNYVKGKLGEDLTEQEGYEAAKLVAAAQLSALKAEIGDLNKVVRIVKVLGMVNATPDYENQPEVINGFSDTMVDIFGERGKHARAAVGMGSLPRNICVEIEMVVEVADR